ncbi:hypothetical protein H4W33_009576 [Kibdelosporangium phytohabitans]|nr:hypothetical protein [Kibdelosporangium phytohabitans]
MPGYHAPDEIAAIARELMTTLLSACHAPAEDAQRTGFDEYPESRMREWQRDLAGATMCRVLNFWTRLHGVLSLELAGHFDNTGFDPARLYQSEVDNLRTP